VVDAPVPRAVVDRDQRAARAHEKREQSDDETSGDREAERERQGEPCRRPRVDASPQHVSQPRSLDRLLGQLLGRRLGRFLSDHGRGVARRRERHQGAAHDGDEQQHEERHASSFPKVTTG
jgi:hypothetical protein